MVLDRSGRGGADAQKGHIAVDILVQRMPWLARVIINAVNAFVSMVLFGIISWQCWKTQ